MRRHQRKQRFYDETQRKLHRIIAFLSSQSKSKLSSSSATWPSLLFFDHSERRLHRFTILTLILNIIAVETRKKSTSSTKCTSSIVFKVSLNYHLGNCVSLFCALFCFAFDSITHFFWFVLCSWRDIHLSKIKQIIFHCMLCRTILTLGNGWGDDAPDDAFSVWGKISGIVDSRPCVSVCVCLWAAFNQMIELYHQYFFFAIQFSPMNGTNLSASKKVNQLWPVRLKTAKKQRNCHTRHAHRRTQITHTLSRYRWLPVPISPTSVDAMRSNVIDFNTFGNLCDVISF